MHKSGSISSAKDFNDSGINVGVVFFVLQASYPCYGIILRYFQGFEMSLQRSASVYNLLNSVLRYCLWLAPSCHAEKEDVLFCIPASGDTSCSHHGNTE